MGPDTLKQLMTPAASKFAGADRATMSTWLQTYNDVRSVQRRLETNPPGSQASSRQALRTLRAIRQRYEIDRARNLDAPFLKVHVALGYADMCWITAAIEVLEKSIAGSATDAAGATGQARQKT